MIFSRNILILSLLVLSGCKTLDNAPITHLYVIDTDNGVCSKRVITDKKSLASRRVGDYPLSSCDGIIGLTPKEFSDLRTFLQQSNP